MLQVIFINSRKEKVPAAQLEEWTSLCQEPCYTEYPAKLLLLQNCCYCYKIVAVALSNQQNYCCCCYNIVVVTLSTLQNYCYFRVKIATRVICITALGILHFFFNMGLTTPF